jgi:hypothetical protein
MFSRRHFKSRSINMLGRKTFSAMFAWGFVLCFLGLGCVSAAACSLRCGMQQMPHKTEAKGLCQPHSCCSSANEPPCDISKGCGSELPEFALSVIPRVKSPGQADMAVSSTEVISFRAYQVGHNNTVWTLATGPPVPLFLMSLSLLC